ncbi:GHKL domain-containing protein [Parasedimentitalea marina]|uniref:histidine kinase n=1 Tax=Parasedimentitalea marina TaxID=2483033 RepID=A0A3T0MYZ0_9RHOB|nr:sensor histidine kinase [Parasedimentitalea marina]AZV76949.1 GHKL domain-containing protein [Parasedimentitalea marina]
MSKPTARELIEEELQKETPDWRLVESLSREEVSQDEENVRFSVDAGHIQRLGVELVGKKDTALSELIKNAFDADATEVNLNFKKSQAKGGTLIISDNGSGMSLETIRNSWMRISTDSKAETPFSPKYQRRRAGRKGIGRFAVQRLAKRLEFSTYPEGDSKGYLVTFNWDEEFRPGLDLNEVFNQVHVIPNAEGRSGTELKMISLRDAWTPPAISKVWKTVLLLQPPFQIASISGIADGKKGDPGFKVRVDGKEDDQSVEFFSIENSFLSQAVADIEARIDEDGNASVRVKSKKLDLDDTQDFDEKFSLVGALTLTSKYFIYHSSILSGMTQKNATSMGHRYGGIRVYKNGFRVLPYGEPSDDWMGMDSAAGRREFLAPGNNSNFFGQVFVGDDDNPLLEETASREGLQENEAFEELQTFAKQALVWAITRVAAHRGRKQTSSQPGFISKIRPPSESIQDAIEVFEKRVATKNKETKQKDTNNIKGDVADKSSEQDALVVLKSVQHDVLEAEEEWERERQAFLQYEAMLRLLASLGLSISVFGHEIKGSREAIRARLKLIEDEISYLAESEEKTELEQELEQLNSATQRLFDIGGYISGLMSKTESRELTELSVQGSLERFKKQFAIYMARQKIEFAPIVTSPSNLRTCEMHASELDTVLLNFLTNSIKSMKKAKTFKRRIRMDARKEARHIVIGFEDNGFGIPEEQKNLIFDAFFTTTLTAEEDELAGPGTGLGLKIVSDIAQSYGGNVSVVEPSEGYNCRIEFRILNSEAE